MANYYYSSITTRTLRCFCQEKVDVSWERMMEILGPEVVDKEWDYYDNFWSGVFVFKDTDGTEVKTDVCVWRLKDAIDFSVYVEKDYGLNLFIKLLTG